MNKYKKYKKYKIFIFFAFYKKNKITLKQLNIRLLRNFSTTIIG